MQRFRPPSLRFHTAATPQVRALLDYPGPEEAFDDRRGVVLRRTPHRITFRTRLGPDCVVFRKLRLGRSRDARREWATLDRLADLGITVPRPLFLAQIGSRSAIGFEEVPGRSVKEQLGELGAVPPGFDRFLENRVRPVVQKLHGAGLVHRDLYWNHVFATDLRAEGPEVALIDVERVRPIAWPRRRRWIVKDLAGLCSSWPLEDRLELARRHLESFTPGFLHGGRSDASSLARAILAKSARIRAHVPKWDGAPGPSDRAWP